MKKTIMGFLLMLIMSISLWASDNYPPENWNPSFTSVVKQAAAEDKYILLNFTGSDWCIWCKRLWKEVFSTDDFKDWADKNAVLAYLDFPSERELSQNQKTQNSYLQQFLGVKGYPSIWLLDSDLTPLLITGYKEGGVDSYLSHLENDRTELKEDQIDQFKAQMASFIEEYIAPLNL